MMTYRFNTIKEAEATIGGLSNPSKMPSYAWSISAKRCNVGAKLAEKKGSVCSGCYALKNRYMFRPIQEALEKRYHAWNDNRAQWKDAMIYLMHNKKHIVDTGVFRWFDSGDIQGMKMLEDINDIAWASPHVTFWLPTKEYGLIHTFQNNIGQAPNLTIRVSGPMVNENNDSGMYFNTSSVFDKDNLHLTDGQICPSSKQDNQCKDCRACWDRNVVDVTYIAH